MPGKQLTARQRLMRLFRHAGNWNWSTLYWLNEQLKLQPVKANFTAKFANIKGSLSSAFTLWL